MRTSFSSTFVNGPEGIVYRKSFFTIYRNLFERLAHDESPFCDTRFPSFGYSTWSWVPQIKTEDREEDVKYFYDVWLNFASAKQFSWVEQWNLSEAPDRRTRR